VSVDDAVYQASARLRNTSVINVRRLSYRTYKQRVSDRAPPAHRFSSTPSPSGGDNVNRVVLGTNRAGSHPPHGGRRSVRAVETTERRYERQLDPQALGDHIDRLYRAARALCGSREEADDLVQETFARVLCRPRTLRTDNDSAYLLQALRNTFVSSRRAASRRPQTCRDQLEFIEDRRAPRAEASVEAAEVYAAISVLPDDFRDALVAIDLVGLSYREAARWLGVREATITTRLYRARQRVARALLPDDAPLRTP
jgi:RNA polymerase sigma-70 factor (ECF subfamily)